MKCLVCKSEVMEKSVTSYFAQLDHCYIIIENVPCYKCNQCGEMVFSVSVLEKIDEILDRAKDIANKILITDYSKAA